MSIAALAQIHLFAGEEELLSPSPGITSRWTAPDASRPALLPADHVRVLHPVGRRGIATLAVREPRWTERVVPLPDLPAYAAAMRGAADVFVSQQSFWGWRRIAQLAQLGALYSDLDYRDTRWAGEKPEVAADAVLHSLDELRIPEPSYIIATGRGLLAVWLHDMMPRQVLPRWMAVQKRLREALKPFGADPQAIDAARVFRLAGTRHSGANAIVRPVWMAAPPGQLWRWSFDDLADEILPLQRAELVALRARRAERAARGEGPTPARRLTAATYWETVLTDLQRLRRHRWFGNLPPGHRDCWLFLAGVAMSWLAPPFALRRELHALATEAGGWSTTECDSRMSSVMARAENAGRGERQTWQGKDVDPRYRFKAGTIVQWLDITPEEMRAAGLRVLIDADVTREHAAERQAASRRRRGVQERAAYEAASLEHEKPWKVAGISRATWFRRRETGPSRCMGGVALQRTEREREGVPSDSCGTASAIRRTPPAKTVSSGVVRRMVPADGLVRTANGMVVAVRINTQPVAIAPIPPAELASLNVARMLAWATLT